MLQSFLTNLGLLMLMHLSINTAYNLSHQKKIPQHLMPYLHIFLVVFTVISMFYFPLSGESQLFDLRLVPIIFITFFHGWKYCLPVLIISSFGRYMMGGEMVLKEILFGTVLPAIVPIIAQGWLRKNLDYFKPILIIAFTWLISVLPVIWSVEDGFSVLKKVAPFHFCAIMLASLIMFFFIRTGIEHLNLTKKLQFYAEHDPLTGLYNMRKFEESVAHFKRPKAKMFIAMVDIDRFKNINDHYGHQAGDIAIKGVAEIIISYCNKNIIASRYGGDEYIFLIAADHLEQVQLLMDSLREKAAETPIIDNNGCCIFPLSLSIGVAELMDTQNLKQAIDQADQQLYLAKKMGRNRVC